MAHVICKGCSKDGECAKVCPVGCIQEGPDQYYINPDECIDCGACIDACPNHCIFPLDDVPADQKSYIEKNAKFFKK